jgi:hypothetical protein
MPHLVRSYGFKGTLKLAWEYQLLSRQFVGYPLDLGHVVVPNRRGLTIIPGDRDTAPCRADDCAKIGGTILPANAVGYFKKPGLIAGHCKYHG